MEPSEYPEPKLIVPDKITVGKPHEGPLQEVPVTPFTPTSPLTPEEEKEALENEIELNRLREEYEISKREAEEAKTRTPESYILSKKQKVAMWSAIGTAATIASYFISCHK